MMHDREKSDPVIVAVKLTNKAVRPAAESVEPRAGAEGNAVALFAMHCPSLDGTALGVDRRRNSDRGLARRDRNQGGCHDRQEHFARQARQRRHDRAKRRSCRSGVAAG